VQDVAFDFYGTRVATASSDKKIKIWDRDASGHWNDYPTYEWRHHRGPVRKLAWSHPCFGSLLASGSDDKYVYVWQEPSGGRGDAHHAAGKTRETPWKGIYHSNDHLAAVVDVAFAPRKFGPCLSTASHDGKIRIFRGSDDQKDINVDHPWNWERQEEFHAGRNRGTPITCHSWNHSPTDMAQSIVVGCGDGSVCVWSYTEAEDGRGLGWAMVCALKTYQGEVHSVSWAPANGRTTHLIASCGATSEGWLPGITISRIKSRFPDAGFAVVDECPIVNSMNVHGHAEQAWKVQWDVTGTTLASAGDDQVVRFWKRTVHGQWECSEFVRQGNTLAGVRGGGVSLVNTAEPLKQEGGALSQQVRSLRLG
jgi:nucleoporin SEH1